jgi:hypothetical protein
MKKNLIDNRFYVNCIVTVFALCITSVASYFVIEYIFKNTVMSDFQEKILYIVFTVVLLLLLSPIGLTKDRKELNRLFKNIDVFEQNKIKKKNMRLIYITIPITTLLGFLFFDFIFTDISWSSSLHKSIARIAVYLSFFAVFGYPFVIINSKRLKKRLEIK